MPTEQQYERAYKDWYCVTTKSPVSLEQYIRIMRRLPKDILLINSWLDEGRNPLNQA